MILVKVISVVAILTLASGIGCSDKTTPPPDEGMKLEQPPDVSMPTISADSLRAAPDSLIFGSKIVDIRSILCNRDFMPGYEIDSSLTVYVGLRERTNKYMTEFRLDFLWVLFENDMWTAEFGLGEQGWNKVAIYGVARGGPYWPVGAEVAVVLGVTDHSGRVQLLKRITEIEKSF